MSADKTQRGLGRGLAALLADSQVTIDEDAPEASPAARDVQTLPLDMIEPNPDQPRKEFKTLEINELANSIREKGLIQPILVRKVDNGKYQIVAGERRWRAAGLASLHDVPVIVRDYSNQEVAEIALIENIQRSNLNPIEEAAAYQDLMTQYDYTQEDIAKVLGKPRSHIANYVRLLKLDEFVQDLVKSGSLSVGHAKVIAGHEHQLHYARVAIKNNMTVRELEQHLASARKPRDESKAAPAKSLKDADTEQLEQQISANLGMKMKIDHKRDQSGKVTIQYKDLEQLDKICELLGK